MVLSRVRGTIRRGQEPDRSKKFYLRDVIFRDPDKRAHFTALSCMLLSC